MRTPYATFSLAVDFIYVLHDLLLLNHLGEGTEYGVGQLREICHRYASKEEIIEEVETSV